MESSFRSLRKHSPFPDERPAAIYPSHSYLRCLSSWLAVTRRITNDTRTTATSSVPEKAILVALKISVYYNRVPVDANLISALRALITTQSTYH